MLGVGYVRDRGTGMGDLVITSRPLVQDILIAVSHYVIFKEKHVKRALELLPRIRPGLSPDEFVDLARDADAFSTLNYSKGSRFLPWMSSDIYVARVAVPL